MGRALWEKWIMQIRLLLHFSQSHFHHFTCCLSWADPLCISSHIGSLGSEIIFNWFSVPYVNLLKIFFFCSFSQQTELVHWIILKRRMMRVMILMEKLMWSSLWERCMLSGRLEKSLWMLIFILHRGNNGIFLRHCLKQNNTELAKFTVPR